MKIQGLGWSAFIKNLGKKEENGFSWELRNWNKLVASGQSASETQAWKDAEHFFAQKVFASSKSVYARGLIKAKIKSWVERRPYLVAAFCDLARQKPDLNYILANVEENERIWHDAEDERLRRPLPSSPLAAKANDIAVKLWNMFVECNYLVHTEETGWDATGLVKWARRMFGPSFDGVVIPQLEGAIDRAFNKAG